MSLGGLLPKIRHFLATARVAIHMTWEAQPHIFSGLVATSIICGLFPAGLALVMKGLINSVIEIGNAQEKTILPLLPWLFLGLGITIGEAVSNFTKKYLNNRMSDELNIVISSKILNHAALLDLPFYENPSHQDLLQRVKNTAPHFSKFLGNLFTLGMQLVQVISLTAILLYIEPLVILVMAPISLGHFIFQRHIIKSLFLDEQARTRNRRWSSYFSNQLTDRKRVPESKALGLAPLFLDKFLSIETEFRDQKRRRYLHWLRGESCFAIISAMAIFGVFAKVIKQVSVGILTVGDVAVFGIAGLRLRGSLASTVSSSTRAMENTLYISNIQKFLKMEPQISPFSGITPPVSKGELAFFNVSFTYPGRSHPTLSNISFKIRPGETIAFVGRNGTGKSTLVKLLARLYDPTEGSILYDGVNLRELSLPYLYRQISFLFQSPTHFEATFRENIALGDWERLLQEREHIPNMVHPIGIDKILANMPDGYDTLLGRQFGNFDLSGGQWKSVALARISARDTPIQIFDEPTAHLDQRAENEFIDNLQHLKKEKTLILMSHRFSTVQMADRIYVLEEGEIVEEGTPHDLSSTNGHYSRLFKTRTKKEGGESFEDHSRIGKENSY